MKAITIKWNASVNGEKVEKTYRIDQPAALAVAVVRQTSRIELANGQVIEPKTYVTFNDRKVAESLARNVAMSNNDRDRDPTKWGWSVKEIDE